jgi:hypothetical protein
LHLIASQIPTASLSLFDPHQQVPRPPGHCDDLGRTLYHFTYEFKISLLLFFLPDTYAPFALNSRQVLSDYCQDIRTSLLVQKPASQPVF